MQQPQTDQQMQQPIHYATPQYQQIQQPIMLCPVQYVYESVLPDEQAQPTQVQPFQNQAYVINVQNTPPWVQNRTNMVYMQPSNIQPYITQHMVQNPYYQYPMIVQEQRQIVPSFMNSMMQNPQIIQNVVNQQMVQTQNSQMMSVTQNPMQNTVQNQLMQSVTQNQVVTQNPALINTMQNQIRLMEKRDTPILASMLNTRKTVHQNELLIRPQYQTVRPQMIIVNPIAKHTCTHNTQKAPPSLPEKLVKSDIQLIKSQVPEGLSVKTIKPVTAMVKPNENLYPNIASTVIPKPKFIIRDTHTYYKRKIKELFERNKDGNEVLAKRNCFIKPDEQNFKAHVGIPSVLESQMNVGPIQTQTISVGPQVDEKKIRNTVFVQARGRVDDTLPRTDVQNINHANNNMSMNIENPAQNNTNNIYFKLNENAIADNVNFKLNNTNIQYLNTIAVNHANVVPNNITNNQQNNMDVNNQTIKINDQQNMHINEIKNLKDVIVRSGNNETNLNTDEAVVSEEVQDVQHASAKEKSNLEEDVVAKETKVKEPKKKVAVKEDNRQEEVELSQTVVSTEGVGNIDNGAITIKKLLSNVAESKPRKTRNTKVLETLTQNKVTITNTGHNKMLESADSNDLQSKSTMTLISKPPKSEDDDLATKSTITDMSNMTNIIISNDKQKLDANQNKSDVTKIIEDKSKKMLEKKLKLCKDNGDKIKKNKKVTTEKPKKAKKNKVKKIVFEEEPIAKYVLTHVLDGHIIQESNVPFEVQKPSLSPAKDNTTQKQALFKEASPEQTIEKTEQESIPAVETEVSSNETDKEDEPKHNFECENETLNEIEEGVDEGHPFKNLKKETFETWTVSDIYKHLMKYEGWRDTAMKLGEQEIDGESLLLVRKEQLIQIDICEEQAIEISEFIEQVQ